MEALELRNRLKEKFNDLVSDDSKLNILEGILDSVSSNSDYKSSISDEHYKVVEERRQNYLSGKTKVTDWDDVKKRIKDKNGF